MKKIYRLILSKLGIIRSAVKIYKPVMLSTYGKNIVIGSIGNELKWEVFTEGIVVNGLLKGYKKEKQFIAKYLNNTKEPWYFISIDDSSTNSLEDFVYVYKNKTTEV